MHGTDEIVNAHYREKRTHKAAPTVVIAIVVGAVLLTAYLGLGFWASAVVATVLILVGCWVFGWAKSRIDASGAEIDDRSSK